MLAALPSIPRHTAPLDLEAGSIVLAIKRLQGYLWVPKFHIFADHKVLKTIGKWETTMSGASRGGSFLTAFDYILDCLLYTSPSPRDQRGSRMPSSA